MKQLLQNLKNGQTTIEDVPVPSPRAGQALVRVAASLVSAGTERMLVEFAEKSLLGKARSRPGVRGFLMVLLLLPFWVSELVRVYGWMILLRESGVLNYFLLHFGLVQRPICGRAARC